MKCPYCGSDEYEAQDIINNRVKGELKEVCVCFKCEEVFEIKYKFVEVTK